MTNATLMLEGHAPLGGTAEIGGDYIRFRTSAQGAAEALSRLDKGQIEIDGRTEQVMVKNAIPLSSASGTGDDAALEVTLQRFTPSASTDV